MTRAGLILRYVAFAAVATVANLGAQRVVLSLGESPAYFTAALIIGTGLGLVVKYALDKVWIFADQTTGIRERGRQFSLYTAMGLVTTAIFWVTEALFWAVWQTHAAREIGALLGLAIGYAVKYRLDRRYVFTQRRSP